MCFGSFGGHFITIEGLLVVEVPVQVCGCDCTGVWVCLWRCGCVCVGVWGGGMSVCAGVGVSVQVYRCLCRCVDV